MMILIKESTLKYLGILLIIFGLLSCTNGAKFEGGKSYVISYEGVEAADSINIKDSLGIEINLDSIPAGLSDSNSTNIGPVIRNSIEFP